MKSGINHSCFLIDSALVLKMNTGSNAKSSASATRVILTAPTRQTFAIPMVMAFLSWARVEDILLA